MELATLMTDGAGLVAAGRTATKDDGKLRTVWKQNSKALTCGGNPVCPKICPGGCCAI